MLQLQRLFCVYFQLHQHEFKLNAAVYQLYLFADKYYETVSGWCIVLFSANMQYEVDLNI